LWPEGVLKDVIERLAQALRYPGRIKYLDMLVASAALCGASSIVTALRIEPAAFVGFSAFGVLVACYAAVRLQQYRRTAHTAEELTHRKLETWPESLVTDCDAASAAMRALVRAGLRSVVSANAFAAVRADYPQTGHSANPRLVYSTVQMGPPLAIIQSGQGIDPHLSLV
jgi:hypothetical protein